MMKFNNEELNKRLSESLKGYDLSEGLLALIKFVIVGMKINGLSKKNLLDDIEILWESFEKHLNEMNHESE